ncbi:MAG TPA: RagB/SusD family nutrient uptake outer membrane protein [Longimicrobiales bacterium]|nr:RagB/SusD family nutrient uptake outer membrane protein [Longimicrobiales bacterium]
MMKHYARDRAARLGRTLAAAALTVLAGGLAAGCGKILEADAPSRVIATDLDNPSYAPLLVKSAVGDFDCALASYITTTAQVVDEFKSVNIYSAEASDYDRRTVNPARTQYATFECGGFGAIYQPLETAVWQADNALKLLDGYTDAQVANRATLIQTAAAYAGYGRVLLGEGFCTAAINVGPELTPAQIFAQADSLFTRAISGPDAQIANMARVGRARARLDLGNGAGALADAQLVPAGFVQFARYSDASTRSQNEVYNRNNRAEGVSIDVQNRNVAFQGVSDPRVKVQKTKDIAPNGIDTVWVQLKYTSLNQPIPVARYEEAQLIAAEVAGGQTAVEIINKLHAKVGLPPFQSTDPAAIRNQVIQERAHELFLEGHRFGDVRRLDIPFDPPTGTPYWQGGTYGSTRCFPLPDLERSNNPNIGPKS